MVKQYRQAPSFETVQPLSWIHRLINRRSFKVTQLIIVCLLNIVDIIVDWSFYIGKSSVLPGLVFGPPTKQVLLSIFVFCVVATATSLLEIIQNLYDVCRKKPSSLLQQLTNLFTLWLEDIPLLTLNLIVVLCRDGEVTYVSLVKAIFGICTAVIRFIFILINKWLIRNDYQKKDCLSRFFNTVSTIGVIFVFSLSVIINILAYLPTDANGNLLLQNPKDFHLAKYSQKKYFENVGVFLSISNDSSSNIFLTHISTIIEQRKMIYEYSTNEQQTIFCLNKHACFDFTKPEQIKIMNETMLPVSLKWTFAYQIPNFDFILGDIKYNIKQCKTSSAIFDIENNIHFNYYRMKKSADMNTTLIHVNNDNYRFYNENDFEKIEHLWRTGVSRCSSTSSYGPHQNVLLQVKDCN